MAEYYNLTDDRYNWLIQQPVVTHCFKCEILDHNERSYGEIIRDVSDDEYYTININNQQGMRRTCTLTMIDVDKKYLPNYNHPFWYNKKFKLYTGVHDYDKGNVYWFAQGVFICSNASAQRYMLTINGVDKFGFLDGTLNTHMIQETYKVEAGSSIGEVIRCTLMLDLGNGLPIDPILPLIDPSFEQIKTINDITLDPGTYLGEIFIQLASMLGADVYYDVNGRMVVRRIFNDDIPFFYIYKGAQWHFDDLKSGYIEPSTNYEMDGCNYIMVATDNTEGEVYSYTAINDNPHSPIAISHVGYRGNKDNPIIYIPVGDTTDKEVMIDRCRQHAEYLLLQKTCMTLAVSFTAPLIPHLDVEEVITITDSYFGYDKSPFLIQSITISGIQAMQISVVNVQWLPTDIEAPMAIEIEEDVEPDPEPEPDPDSGNGGGD